MDKILLTFLSKTLGKSKEQIAEILYNKSEDGTNTLKENALDSILALDKERVSGFKIDKTKVFDDAFDKATKKVKSKIENKLIEAYSLSNDFKGKGVDNIIQELLAKGKKPEITEQDIKNSSIFLEVQRANQKRIEELEAEKANISKSIEAKFENQQVLMKAKEKAISIFESLNPVLSEDPKKAANQKRDFISKLDGKAFKVLKDDTYVLLDENGNVQQDDHGNAKTLSQFITKKASNIFDFKKQKQKGSPGNTGDVTVPKTEEEYTKAFFEAKTPEERIAIKSAWESK